MPWIHGKAISLTGFPQALDNMENGWKKFHTWKNHGIWTSEKNHGILAWDCFLDVNITLIFLARSTIRNTSFFNFWTNHSKPSFLHRKTRFFVFIQYYLCNVYLYSIIWLKEGRMPYFDWSWTFNDRSWNYHGKILEFLISVGTLEL